MRALTFAKNSSLEAAHIEDPGEGEMAATAAIGSPWCSTKLGFGYGGLKRARVVLFTSKDQIKKKKKDNQNENKKSSKRKGSPKRRELLRTAKKRG